MLFDTFGAGLVISIMFTLIAIIMLGALAFKLKKAAGGRLDIVSTLTAVGIMTIGVGVVVFQSTQWAENYVTLGVLGVDYQPGVWYFVALIISIAGILTTMAAGAVATFRRF